MDSKDVLSYRAVSEILTGNPDTIRKNNVPKKYEEKIQELRDYVDTWINRHKNTTVK